MLKMLKLLVVVLFAMVCFANAGNPEDAEATILKYENEITPEGSYNYAYETSNNIKGEESGVGSSYATGSYSYTSPEGQLIQLEYTADENGFQPKGEHLPTPPPIPDYILKALKYIEEHPFQKVDLTKKK